MLEPAIQLDPGWPWVTVLVLTTGPGDDDDDDDDDPNTGGSGGNIDPDDDEGYDDEDDEDDDEEPLQVSGSRHSFAAPQQSVLSSSPRRPAKFDGCPPQH